MEKVLSLLYNIRDFIEEYGLGWRFDAKEAAIQEELMPLSFLAL